MEAVVFVIAAALALFGATGVILARNPVHSALFLVTTLFAMAILFLNLDAQFLAAVQVIVYAGAIVVLFLFVIMLLGVDQAENIGVEPIAGQRPLAVLLGIAVLCLGFMFVAVSTDGAATGLSASVETRVDSITEKPNVAAVTLDDDQTSGTEQDANINQLGRVIFTDYVYAFEITALLLTIAVVGAVVLTRTPKGELQPIPEPANLAAVVDDDDETSDGADLEAASAPEDNAAGSTE